MSKLPVGAAAVQRRPAPRAAERAAVSSSSNGGRPRFARDTGFHKEVIRRVLESFAQTGLSQRDSPRMFVKTAALLLWFGATYALLVFVATTWLQAVLLSFSLALAMAGVAFAVQHDANHGAYSDRRAVNRLLGFTLDMLGASSYIWRWKHNNAHHPYTNINRADSDIDVPFGRLSPAQPHSGIHRLQHYYLWGIYGLFVIHWQLFEDFKQVAEARIAENRFPRPRGWQLIGLIGGKALFFGWAFVIPMLFHPWWVVLLFYAATSIVLSFILVLVFQLAHSVEEAAHPVLAPDADAMPSAWAVHQVEATVDFARDSRLLSWYVGGLNFQIEHHLFPRISHVHYPHIAPIVQAVCAEYGVRYTASSSLLGAIASHGRWLRRMGQRPAEGPSVRHAEVPGAMTCPCEWSGGRDQGRSRRQGPGEGW